ncbi:hypothetical protein MRX96_019508 [Rhipicephalus microplus]
MASEDENAPKCDLEGDGCVRLSSILHAFGAPIREEQAWAVCYQTSKCMCKEWAADNRGCYCLTATSQLRIHKDGSVHTSTVRDLGPGARILGFLVPTGWPTTVARPYLFRSLEQPYFAHSLLCRHTPAASSTEKAVVCAACLLCPKLDGDEAAPIDSAQQRSAPNDSYG